LAIEEQDITTFYPNPFFETFTFRINGNDDELAEVHVLTITGVPVETFVGLKANRDYHVGGAWKAGVYLLKIKTSGRTAIRKVSKQ
jgi:hypothetical protein